MNSIRLHLLKWLIGPILAINLAGGALTYLLAWMPAQIVFDQSLTDAAGALAARVHADLGRPAIDLPPQAEQVLRADPVDALYFVARAGAGPALAGDADFPALQAGAGRAPRAYDGSMRGEPVRIAVVEVDAGGQTVQVGVAKTLRKRRQLRSAIVRTLVLLETLFTLALVGMIWFSVTNGLLPLNRMRADLNARDGDDLSPISPERIPYELTPVVSAFNDLLDKVQAGARAQQSFLADVAHQLRTPLAGLRTQLEWLRQRHQDEPESARSIALMRSATERMIRQTNQLLSLARAEPSHFEKTRLEPLDLARLVGESVQHFVEQAAARRIDLGFQLERSVVLGDPFLLRDLVDNLVDNALRYTPEGGTVNVGCRVADGAGLLEVDDSGPGIPPAKRELVFNRFVRLDETSTGSGLGLAIVRDIALAHGAALRLDDNPAGQGTLVTLRFALA